MRLLFWGLVIVAVDVKLGQLDGSEITWPSAQSVHARVSVHSRKPLVDAYVSLTAADRPWWRPSVETIAPSGVATLDVAPGMYRAFVGATGCQDIFRLVRVTRGMRELRFDIEPEIVVGGVVLDEQGKPLDAEITQVRLLGPTRLRDISDLAHRYFAPRWSTRTDTNGRWTMAANGEGSLALLIEAPGFAPAMTWLTASRDNQRTVLKKGSSLHVNLDRADSEVALMLLRDAAPACDVPADWQSSVWSRSGDPKTVEWTSLPPGTYHILARYPDPLRFAHAVSLGTVTLAQGQDVTSSLALPPEPGAESEVARLFVPDKTTADLTGAIARANGASGPDEVRLSIEAVSGGVVLYLDSKAPPAEIAVTTPTQLIAAAELAVTPARGAALQTFISDRADVSLALAVREAATPLPRSAVARFYDCNSEQRFVYPADVAGDGAIKLPYPAECRSMMLEAPPYEPLFIQAKLQAKESKSLGIFTLRTGAIAEIHAVHDPGGQAAARAIIRVLASDAIQPIVVASGTADENGRLRLRALPADRELIVEGRDPIENFVGSKTLTLEAGTVTTIDPLPIPLPARVTITARLAPEFRERFPDARIQQVLIDRDGDVDQKERRAAPPGKNGEVVFERLQPGTWHPTALVEAGGLPQPIPFHDLDLQAGDDKRAEAEVRPVVLNGTITSAGKGIGAMIGFAEAAGPGSITRFARSETDGRFTIILPGAGIYTITAARSRDEQIALGELRLEEGQSIDLTLPDATMLVRVKENGQPVAGAGVTAMLRRPSLRGGVQEVIRTVRTDAAGEVSLDALLAGRWGIEARHPAIAHRAQGAVDLLSGDRTVVELDLTPPAMLGGFVHDSAGAPVGGARVDCIFVGAGNLPQTARADTDPEGHFAIELSSPPPSRLHCGVTAPGGVIAAFITGATDSADFRLPSNTAALAIPDWGEKPQREVYWLVADDGRMFSLSWAASKLEKFWSPLYLPRIPAGSWKIVRAGTLDELVRLAAAGGNALSPLIEFQAEKGKAQTVELKRLGR